MDDWQLLREYADRGSDAAFTTLVERHLGLVYGACLREVRDADLAQDVTQSVFLVLARKAGRIRRGTVLAGWLFNTARFACRNALRQQARRKAREEHAAREAAREEEMRPDDRWDEIEPFLHSALAGLRSGEREAVLLRFFEERSLKEIGTELGISEKAAHMRVSRGVDKLRTYFERRGVVVSAVGLAGSLALQAAPASAEVSARSVTALVAGKIAEGGGASLPVFELAEGVIHEMKMLLIKKTAAGAAGLMLLGGGLAVGARALEEKPAPPPGTTAAEVLKRLGEAHDKTGSFVAKIEHVVEGLVPRGVKPRTTISDLRVDMKTGRFARRMPFQVEGEEPTYTSHLFDGTQYFTYTLAPGNKNPRLSLERRGAEMKKRAAAELREHHPGGPSMGYFRFDPDRADKLLLRAKSLTLRPAMERIGKSDCFVLEGKTSGGAYTLWIDPQHGYNLARGEMLKGKGDVVNGRALTAGMRVREVVENTRFEQLGGVWTPMEGTHELEEIFPESPVHPMHSKGRHKVLSIQLSPDFDALGAFKPDDIRDGTRVYLITPDRNFFPIDSKEGKFTWRDGKLAPPEF
jgi:RNA polymerase sigma factor (sigma-70 family)